VTEPLTRCARGPRCYTAERHPDSDTLLGGPATRELCEVCEGAVAHALDEAPVLYVRLRLAARRRTVAARSEMVTTSKGSPLPLGMAALTLGEELRWLLTTWEDEVRIIARLADAARDGAREAVQIERAAFTLAQHLTTWLSAPSTAFSPDRWTAEFDQSGAEAACALLEWRHRARNLPGVHPEADKALRRFPQPCPTCEVAAVTHRAGDDLTHCQSCGATAPYLEHLGATA
jgi:hypothetical protein